MALNVLITGGAGFIGTRLARRLLEKGHSLRILDNLSPQVHGENARPAAFLTEHCEFRRADVTDREALAAALEHVDTVVHLAAETGPAQSLYQVEHYSAVNVQATAALLQEVLARRDRIRRLVVASSRAIYGEGKYRCPACGPVYPEPRRDEDLRAGRWEPFCPCCDTAVEAVPTDEPSTPKPTSIYAVTKLTQEQMCLVTGRAYGIPTVALRYQNVYGPGQSLTNPYIGVLAIFSARIRSASPIEIYEDGQESRDFVHVEDVAHATQLAVEEPASGAAVFNVGSGERTTLLAVAQGLARAMQREVPIRVCGKYRVGDIRHCYADLAAVGSALGYRPSVGLESGLAELAAWALEESSFSNELDRATGELARAGLFRGRSEG